MNIEYEATFTRVNKDTMRENLPASGARLVRKEFLQRRFVFAVPDDPEITHRWVRVRDEGDKITMSYKSVKGDAIADQKEICIQVDDFEEAITLLEAIGCKKRTYEETKREQWELDGVEITIDEWPFLEPFVEVEGVSEDKVRQVSEKIGFDWQRAKFCAIGALYKEKYGVTIDEIHALPKIVFDMENPFVNRK